MFRITPIVHGLLIAGAWALPVMVAEASMRATGPSVMLGILVVPMFGVAVILSAFAAASRAARSWGMAVLAALAGTGMLAFAAASTAISLTEAVAAFVGCAALAWRLAREALAARRVAKPAPFADARLLGPTGDRPDR
jgi:hypothetical protein